MIYVDLLIIFNSLFDYILLNSVNYILRRNVSLKRLLFSSVLGNVTLVLLFIKNYYVFVLGKVICALFINIVCFKYKDIKYTFKNIIYFYLVSMLMSGVISFFDREFMWGDNGLISNDSNVSNYFIVIIVSLLVILYFIRKFIELKNHYSSYYNCLIYLDDNNKINVSAFLDTGNKLKDPYTNKNIILLNKKVLGDIRIRSPIYVPFNSLNNHGLLECFKVKKIVIDGKENDNFLVGLSECEMFIDGIDCILNTKLMEGLK